MFTSSRNGFLPNKDYTFPNLQLFVMDEDGKNVEQIRPFEPGQRAASNYPERWPRDVFEL